MTVEFAYAQARAQARHGDRLAPSEWRMLESSRSLAQYLHLARDTALGPRLRHFSRTTSPHAIERSLRHDWHAEVDSVSHWLPQRWGAAVRWTRWLPDLPALTYLLQGGRVPAWMGRDPTLAQVAVDDTDDRLHVIRLTEPVSTLARYGEQDLAHSWLSHWRSLWPADDHARVALDELVDTVSADLGSVHPKGPACHGLLESRTLRLMRRNINQPVVTFCHLLLTALQCYRLRYGLLQRALFNDVAGEDRE
jgi:hypothetical protein